MSWWASITLDQMNASAPVVRLLDLRETPLEVSEVLEALADPAVGGIDVFVGTVRDHDGGQGVTGLDYSAHPTALARLQEVAEGVAVKYDVLGVAAVHRVGPPSIGVAPGLVGPTAAHRAEAFDASRALIDDLKATVPIWKHKLFSDGTDEWVGTP